MADHHHPPLAQRGKAAQYRLIVGKGAIARQRQEIVEHARDIILEMRTFGMTRHLRLLPGRQFGIGIGQHFGRALLQRRDFAVDIDVADAGSGAQFDNARFQLGNGLFKFQKADHGAWR